MWIGLISLFPEMVAGALSQGVVSRAIASDSLRMHYFNPRDFTHDRHRTVDDRPYGGGAGMVMLVEPLRAAVSEARATAPSDPPVVLLTPQGSVFSQNTAMTAKDWPGLILVCGRYEGVDQRFIEGCVDLEWSIGDFVLSGGELPALVVIDAIARHLPGTLGNRMSALDESHLDGMLDYPQYTRPESDGLGGVPKALLSGDHNKVAAFRREQALLRTYDRRPDLLVGKTFDPTDQALFAGYFDSKDGDV